MTEQERINAEVSSFFADRRHADYIENERNANLMGEWVDSEGLQASAESLHAAYQALRGELDVYVYPTYAELIFPPPTPATPPPPQATASEAQVDTRLHVAERLPGESRLGVLQRSFAAEIAAQRKARMQMRTEVQSMPPRKTQSREISNQYAAAKKPRGRGAAFVIENGE